MKKEISLPKVEDIYRTNYWAFRPDDSVLHAIEAFNKNRFTSAPVIDVNKSVIGYLSESDCLKKMAVSLFYDDFAPTVESAMSNKVFYAEPDWDIFELEDFFVKKEIVSAPILGSNNILKGVVTRSDVLLCLEKLMIDKYR